MSSRRPLFRPEAIATSASIISRSPRIRCWASSQVWNRSCVRTKGDRPDRARRAARARAFAIQEGAARLVRQAWLYQACFGLQERTGGVFHCAGFRQRAPGILGSVRGKRTRAAATTDLILVEPRFRIPDTFHFLVSADNPQN